MYIAIYLVVQTLLHYHHMGDQLPATEADQISLLHPLYLLHRVIYSKTSDNGHSDKRTTSLQWQTACPLPLTVHTFLPPTKGHPPNNGQNARPQRVHYSEVPL